MKDRDRIRDIYSRQAGRAYRTAMIYMKNPQDAEDIVQSVFLTLIEKDIQFEDPGHEKAWFIVAVRNRCKDLLKSAWRSYTEPDEGGPAPSSAEPEVYPAAGEDDRDTVIRLLKMLPEEQREMIFLHFYEGYTVKETAEMMGVRETRVRSGIVSARKLFNSAGKGESNGK